MTNHDRIVQSIKCRLPMICPSGKWNGAHWFVNNKQYDFAKYILNAKNNSDIDSIIGEFIVEWIRSDPLADFKHLILPWMRAGHPDNRVYISYYDMFNLYPVIDNNAQVIYLTHDIMQSHKLDIDNLVDIAITNLRKINYSIEVASSYSLAIDGAGAPSHILNPKLFEDCNKLLPATEYWVAAPTKTNLFLVPRTILDYKEMEKSVDIVYQEAEHKLSNKVYCLVRDGIFDPSH